MAEPFILQKQALLFLDTWSKQYPNLVAGFSTKNEGFSYSDFSTLNVGLHVNDDEKHVLLNRQKVAEQLGFPLNSWVCADQIHGNQIMKVGKESLGKGASSYKDCILGTDGLYTYEKNLLLALCFADCVPLYFFSPKKELIGVAHAGWKGTVKNIAGEMVNKWNREENVNLTDIHVAIGPSIGPCCYIVDDRVIKEVDHVLNSYHEFKPYQQTSVGQYRLDLKEINYLLLKKAGVADENISISSYCTSCESSLFFSHRRDNGKTGRMMSFIAMKEA